MNIVQKAIRKSNIVLYPRHLYYGPEWLVLGVNNICNLHCKMCDVGLNDASTNFYHNLVGSHPLNMPVELIQKLSDQAKRFYPHTKFGFAFTEPLIYPHLEEALELTSGRGFHTTITTNALTLRKQAPMLVEKKLDHIFISLDGPENAHNEIRGHKSSFQRAIEGMQALWDIAPGFKISVFCVITEWNIGRLLEFVEYFKEMPLSGIGFMHPNFTTPEMADVHNAVYGAYIKATHSNDTVMDLQKFDLGILWEEISAIRRTSWKFPVSFSPEFITKDNMLRFYQKPSERIGKICNDAFRSIMIKSDGSVIPSHGRCFNISLGNLYQKDLRQIWNSTEAGRFRSELMKSGGLFPSCTRCCSAF